MSTKKFLPSIWQKYYRPKKEKNVFENFVSSRSIQQITTTRYSNKSKEKSYFILEQKVIEIIIF